MLQYVVSREGRVLPAFVAVAAVWLLASRPAGAMIFSASQDPAYHTSAPTGTYANSGWRQVGKWGPGSGIAISPYHVLTAKHFTPGDGSKFVLGGQSYALLPRDDPEEPWKYDDPETDLRIVVLAEPVHTWATLYTGSGEYHKDSVIYGRGRTAGDPVSVNGERKGWQWGIHDGLLRWGTNRIEGWTVGGELLGMDFDGDAGDNEATFTQWDSGGGQFIRDSDGQWKLAGVLFAVEHLYRYTEDGETLEAGLFDQGGLYVPDDQGGWKLKEDTGYDKPQWMYSTRVSPRIGWINDLIDDDIPIPGDVDLDGDVDFSDAWATFGAYKVDGEWGWPDGDFTHDGIVDEADAALLLDHYEDPNSFVDVSTLQEMFGLPEPATLVLLGLGGSVLLRRRR